MPRPLAVDDDALARAVLIDALRDASAEAPPTRRGFAAPDRVRESEFAPILTDERMAEMDGFELSLRVFLLNAPAGRPAVAAPAPPAAAPVSRPAAPPASPDDTWSGADFLGAVDGPLERFPPARVLFLAHRVEASGRLEIRHAGGVATIGVRAGRVVQVEGVPRLFADLPVPEGAALGVGLGHLASAGFPVDDAMRAAADGLGRWIAALGTPAGATATWTGVSAFPPGVFALPTPVPRLLAAGLRAEVGAEALEAAWGARAQRAVRLAVPDDAPDLKWGLDMTALRLIRLAPREPNVGSLVRAAVGAQEERRGEVLRALDLLLHLGILHLGEEVRFTPPARPAADTPEARTPRAPPPVGRTAPPPADARPVDPRLAAFVAEETRLRGLHPVEVLGLADAKRPLTGVAVARAFHELSRGCHPDALHDAAPEVRQAAAQLFHALREANAALSSPGGLDDAGRFLDARAQGLPYVSDADQKAARVSFRKGEVLFRNREYRHADAPLEAAARQDPLTWPYGLYAAWCGYLSRRLPVAEALARIDALTPRTPGQESERFHIRATLLKLEGRMDEAVKAWKAALEKDPENHDAQRELRLFERRTQEAAPPARKGGLFGGFGRKG